MAKVGQELGVTPGDEFRAARETAELQGARLILGDRPVRVTLARTWRALSTWERVRFAWLLLVSGADVISADKLRKHVDALSDSDVVTEALREMADAFPSMMGPLIHERDEYMVAKLRGAATSPGVRDVVAVVGRGHCDGIEARWNDRRVDPVELEQMPETSKRVDAGAYVWVRRVAVRGRHRRRAPTRSTPVTSPRSGGDVACFASSAAIRRRRKRSRGHDASLDAGRRPFTFRDV